MATVVATRALSYTRKADNGKEIFATAARGEEIEVADERLKQLREKGSVADPGTPEAVAATQRRPVGHGSAYIDMGWAAGESPEETLAEPEPIAEAPVPRRRGRPPKPSVLAVEEE